MAKNNKNNKKQENKKPSAAPKSPKPAPQKPEVETAEVEVLNTGHADTAGEAKVAEALLTKYASGVGNGLSLDGRVRLLDLASRRFVESPDAAEKYGEGVVKAMDRLTACGIIATFADEAVCGKGSFAMILQNNMYPMLVSAAKDMGIDLPALKYLEAPIDKNGKVEEGKVVVKAEDVTISDETKEQVKKENEIVKKGDAGEIELDPVKVAHMSEDDLKAALNYILITNLKRHKNIKESLVKAVDFMQAYRLELAGMAENAGEAKEKIAERSMYAILNDLFNYITPAIHLKGIGIGMKNTMVNEGTPLSSFLILRKTLTDKETGKVEWDDQSIADATRALIELAAKDRIKASEATMAELDPKKDKIAIEGHQNEIKNNKKILEDLACVSFDIITRLDNPDTTEDEAAISHKALGRVYEQYYPEVNADERPRWIGLEENIRQRAGIILNLFREPSNKNQLFDESNIVKLEKMSLEDYEKLQAEKKAAELEAKKADSKNA